MEKREQEKIKIVWDLGICGLCVRARDRADPEVARGQDMKHSHEAASVYDKERKAHTINKQYVHIYILNRNGFSNICLSSEKGVFSVL